MKKVLRKVASYIRCKYCSVVLKFKRLDLKVLSIDETIGKLKSGYSMVRFGDGEFRIMGGLPQSNYQNAEEGLSKGLKKVIKSAEENTKLLVCIPNIDNLLENCTEQSKKYWTIHFVKCMKYYKENCRKEATYGDAFVTRPYMTFKDRSKSSEWFKELRSLFDDKEFVLIEGKYSRLGVGNDLFENVKSLERILCPPKNSYEKYDEILAEAKKVSKDKTILLSMGPAGKVLAYELFKEGYTVMDIGHIDSEYEWFLMQAQSKITIANKHTAEGSNNGEDIGECNDVEYLDSIIAEIY